MPTPPINLSADAVQFLNNAAMPDILKGELTIGHDRGRRDFSAYELHWGRNEKDKIGPASRIKDYGSLNVGTEAAPLYVFNQPLTHTFDNTAVPDSASHLLVFVTDSANQQRLYASRPLLNREHLLPVSATRLERGLAATSGRLSQLPVRLDSLWDPDRCPAPLLPWLAWSISSDIWFDDKEDPVRESIRRRELIRKSAFVHQHKGTRAAIQTALDAFSNVSVTLTEWWQQSPPGFPHTFQIDLLVNGNTPGAGSAELNNKLRQTIDAIKPVRSHYNFTLSTVQTAGMRLAAGSEVVSYKRFNMAAVI